ncbi:hypothetical protein PENANT_c193G06442 [Penicillium antarcticum]|uniref:Uncharacterized protein n=1 Tax=Penicillium antarcticum TaxID=416450 RepID=A0A1V6PAD1_9EURO|nr:hypothetical protein PENANT_c193G06442 [Penicillium antarcticum]
MAQEFKVVARNCGATVTFDSSSDVFSSTLRQNHHIDWGFLHVPAQLRACISASTAPPTTIEAQAAYFRVITSESAFVFYGQSLPASAVL